MIYTLAMPIIDSLSQPVLAAESGLGTGSVILLVIVGVALLALFIGAVVSILSSPTMNGQTKAVWVVICLILQFFGPLAWFIWGRKAFSQAA